MRQSTALTLVVALLALSGSGLYVPKGADSAGYSAGRPDDTPQVQGIRWSHADGYCWAWSRAGEAGTAFVGFPGARLRIRWPIVLGTWITIVLFAGLHLAGETPAARAVADPGRSRAAWIGFGAGMTVLCGGAAIASWLGDHRFGIYPFDAWVHRAGVSAAAFGGFVSLAAFLGLRAASDHGRVEWLRRGVVAALVGSVFVSAASIGEIAWRAAFGWFPVGPTAAAGLEVVPALIPVALVVASARALFASRLAATVPGESATPAEPHAWSLP